MLSWASPADSTGFPVTGYMLYINDGQGGPVATTAYTGRGSLATSTQVSGLTGGRQYMFQVSALSNAGESDYSTVAAIATAPVQVTGVASAHQTTNAITLPHIITVSHRHSRTPSRLIFVT